MLKITDYTDKLIALPRPNRRAIEEIVKEIYKKGKEDERQRILKITKNRDKINHL